MLFIEILVAVFLDLCISSSEEFEIDEHTEKVFPFVSDSSSRVPS